MEIAPRETVARDRLIFWMYYRQGFTAKAIAAIPSISLTVKGVEGVIQRLTGQLRRIWVIRLRIAKFLPEQSICRRRPRYRR